MIAGTSTDNGILTPEQIEYFKTNGYLVLENFVEGNVVESWRKQIWAHLDVDLSNPGGWPDQYVVEGLKIEPESQIFGQLAQVRAGRRSDWRRRVRWRRWTSACPVAPEG